jgi:hypothetical protein
VLHLVILGLKIDCKCTECSCKVNFEMVDGEELLNLIQHGRLDDEKIAVLKTRVGSKVCKHCFVGQHYK